MAVSGVCSTSRHRQRCQPPQKPRAHTAVDTRSATRTSAIGADTMAPVHLVISIHFFFRSVRPAEEPTFFLTMM